MKVLKPALLALVCAALLALTNQETRSTISANQQHFEEKELRLMAGGHELEKTADGYNIIIDGKRSGRIRSVTTNEGYNGRIALLVAMNTNRTIITVRVVDHRETPGIGDDIDHRVSDWIFGFDGLMPGEAVDGITGATITSRAVNQAVANAVSEVPTR